MTLRHAAAALLAASLGCDGTPGPPEPAQGGGPAAPDRRPAFSPDERSPGGRRGALVIVGLGDSTTAGTPHFLSPLEAPPDGKGDPEGQWGHWAALERPSWSIHNRGVNGERTDHILARFDSSLKGLAPHYVVVLAGVNDIYQGRPDGELRKDLGELYRRVRALGAVAVAGTILPFNTATPEQRRRIRETNAWIREHALLERLPLCDFNAAAAAPGDPDRLAGSPDGLHPDVAGYRAMGEALVRVIDGLEAPTPR